MNSDWEQITAKVNIKNKTLETNCLQMLHNK